MKATANTGSLVDAVELVASIIKGKPKPPMDGLLIIPGKKKLFVRAYTHDLDVTARVLADNVTGTKPVLVDAKRFLSVCRAFKGTVESVDLSLGDGEMPTLVAIGGGANYSIPTEDADDFPAEQDVDTDVSVEIAARDFLKLADRTKFCVAPDGGRYAMDSILFTLSKGAWKVVATDGKRLSIATMAGGAGALEVLVPPHALALAKKITAKADSENLDLAVLPDHRLAICTGRVTALVTPGGGEFPPYKDVVEGILEGPKTRRLIFDREDLLRAVRKVLAVKSKGSDLVALKITFAKDTVTFDYDVPGIVRSHGTTTLQQESGPKGSKSFVFGVNSSFLEDALRAIDTDQIKLRIEDGKSAMMIEAPGWTHVLMPVQIV